MWWQHEILHREALRDFAARLAVFNAERDLIEKRFLAESVFFEAAEENKKLQFSQECFNDASRIEEEWINRIKDKPLESRMPVYHALAWRGFNRKAGL